MLCWDRRTEGCPRAGGRAVAGGISLPGDAEASGSDPRTLLSPKQLECVRLVSVGPSKVIAQHAGLSHNTVDQRIKEAMRRLGATTRYEAAAIVADWDRQPPPQDLGSQTPGLAPWTRLDAFSPCPTRTGGTAGGADGNVLREERAEFGASSRQSRPLGTAFEWREARKARQTPAQRMKWMAGITLATCVALLVLLAVAESLNRTLLQLSDLAR